MIQIKLFLEYKNSVGEYICLAEYFNLPTDYELFQRMGYDDGSTLEKKMLARGLPEGISDQIHRVFFLPVVDDESWIEDDNATTEMAEDWIAAGDSFYSDAYKHSVSNPYLINTSHLTTAEFEWILDGAEDEYQGILHTMKRLKERDPQAQPRIVFWFQ